MATLCDHFPGRLPSEILREIDRLPVGLLDEIIEAKCYQQAKALTDAADTAEARKRLPRTPIFEWVTTIEFALAQEEMDAIPHG